jgi:hypothetical protein
MLTQLMTRVSMIAMPNSQFSLIEAVWQPPNIVEQFRAVD